MLHPGVRACISVSGNRDFAPAYFAGEGMFLRPLGGRSEEGSALALQLRRDLGPAKQLLEPMVGAQRVEAWISKDVG